MLEPSYLSLEYKPGINTIPDTNCSLAYMPMCAPDCDCKWCRMSEMSDHPLFKDKLDALLEEFNPHFVQMRNIAEVKRLARVRERRIARLECQVATLLASYATFSRTSLEAQVALDVNDDPAVAKARDAPQALDVAGD